MNELSKALAPYGRAFLGVGVFSAVVNLLMLTGPLFMLQVYDRVLSSKSSATLAFLFLIVVFLYGLMGLLDHYRGRVLARIGAG
jgi:ATP-binding cassette subfamily C protein